MHQRPGGFLLLGIDNAQGHDQKWREETEENQRKEKCLMKRMTKMKRMAKMESGCSVDDRAFFLLTVKLPGSIVS